jgi:hypothetical protein
MPEARHVRRRPGLARESRNTPATVYDPHCSLRT